MKNYFYLFFVFHLLACSTAEGDDKALEVKVEQVPSPTTESLRGISIPLKNVAWLSGASGTVLRSLNGGESWEKLPAPDIDSLDFRDVEAFSENSAVVMSSGHPCRIYKTKDAGISWKLVYENKDSAAFLNSIAFRNAKEGIAFGDQLNACHLILKTSDGGSSWRRIGCEKIPKPLAVENGFAASGSCIAIDAKMHYHIGLGGNQSRIFTSPKGEVWRAIQTPIQSKSSSSGIYSIATGANRLIALGGDYLKVDSSSQILRSINGVNWEIAAGGTNGYRSVVDYSNELGIWMSGGTNGLDYSQDRGSSWLKFSDLGVNTLQFFPNSNTALAANSKGKIFLLKVESKQEAN